MKYKLEIELELPEQVDRELFRTRVMAVMDQIEYSLQGNEQYRSPDNFAQEARFEIENLIIEQRKLIYG